MKDEKLLHELLIDYEIERDGFRKEYDKYFSIIKNKEIPIGKEESVEFHRELKNVEYGKIRSEAEYNLLKYILEIE